MGDGKELEVPGENWTKPPDMCTIPCLAKSLMVDVVKVQNRMSGKVDEMHEDWKVEKEIRDRKREEDELNRSRRKDFITNIGIVIGALAALVTIAYTIGILE